LFYLIAPLIAAVGVRLMIALLIIGVAIKIVLLMTGIPTYTPLGRQFFPAELTYFMLGMLSFEIYQTIKPRIAWCRKWAYLIIATAVTLILCYGPILNYLYPKSPLLLDAVVDPVFFGAFFFLVPLLFRTTEASVWDSCIGDFSYPIYVTHILAINAAFFTLRLFPVEGGWLRFEFYLFAILATAMLGLLAVVWPVENWRGRRTLQQRYAMA
jgi:hypothetical protein